MAKRDLQESNYKSMDDEYKEKFSRDEFKGQKRAQAKSRARKAGDTKTADSINTTNQGKMNENSQYYKENENGKRELTSINEGSNPFKVDNIQDFDTSAYGKGSAKGKEKFNMQDVVGLKKQGRFSTSEIQAYTQGLQESGAKVGKGALRKLNKMEARAEAKERAKGDRTQQPETPPNPENPTTPTPPTPTPGPGTGPGPGPAPTPPPSQVIGGDTGDVGKSGDQQTTVGDIGGSNYGDIGNDYSVTIGNTGNQGGGGSGLSNMMGALAYGALNNNAHAQSKAGLNGTTGAASAIALGEEMTGATERTANLYNMVGASQNYWNDKAVAQQGSYLGDIWNMGNYEWSKPQSPESTPDRTSEILNDDDDD